MSPKVRWLRWLPTPGKNQIWEPLLKAKLGETYKRTVEPIAGPPDMTTVILWDENRAYTYSEAVLRSTRRLGGLIGLGSRIAILCPRVIRDGLYRFVSRNRYRWFGKADSCRVPVAGETARFLP